MQDNEMQNGDAAGAETVQTEAGGVAISTPLRALSPLYFYLIVGMVFVADQMSKNWIKATLPGRGGEIPIIGDAFVLSLTYNHGGAWGVLPHGNSLFVIFASFAIVALTIAYHRMRHLELFVGTAFALALGGALGNLLDRLRFGSVVDFFYAKIINFPIFNVADSAITVGIFLLLIHFLRTAKDEKEVGKEVKKEVGKEEVGEEPNTNQARVGLEAGSEASSQANTQSS